MVLFRTLARQRGYVSLALTTLTLAAALRIRRTSPLEALRSE
jgi:hypothetical protein